MVLGAQNVCAVQPPAFDTSSALSSHSIVIAASKLRLSFCCPGSFKSDSKTPNIYRITSVGESSPFQHLTENSGHIFSALNLQTTEVETPN